MDDVSPDRLAGRGKDCGGPQDRNQTQALGVFMLNCP
jgi:hypothetical protein